jgi:hypothetical protein
MDSSDDEMPLAQINKKSKRKVEEDDDDFDAPSRKARPKPTKSYVEESDSDADSDEDAFEEPDSKKVRPSLSRPPHSLPAPGSLACYLCVRMDF